MALLLVPPPVRGIVRIGGRKLLGLVFLAVVGGLITLSIAIYNQVFTPYLPVTLRASRIGNQLNVPADVKLRGIIVGQVRGVHTSGSGATLDLAIKPSDVGLIPANVQAMILPKTLFGEKFVDLVLPAHPSPQHILAHAVIPQDRSQVAIETERVFADLMPMLHTLQPAKLNETLSAIATALQGRGQELGNNLVLADQYLRSFNPHLPTVESDLAGLAALANNLNVAAPNLLQFLANVTVNANTISAQATQINGFLVGTSGFATTATNVLNRNGDNLIHLAADSRPVLGTLAANAGTLPYIFGGLTAFEPRLDQAFGGQGPFLHITLQTVPDPGPYQPGPADCPRYGTMTGKDCGTPPAQNVGGASLGVLPAPLAGGQSTGPVGTLAEKSMVNALVAPQTGVSAGQLGDLPDLLVAPVLRGTQVGFS